MKEIVLKISDDYYFTFIHFLKTLNYVELEEREVIQAPPKKYDFSDICGKLEWKGDAVREQRLLRDERYIF